MPRNKTLTAARVAKQDEFYTQRKDIESELCNYTEHFRGKIAYCNCDNPEHSEFWKYFADNFNQLGLRKLMATYYETERQNYVYSMEPDGNGTGQGTKLEATPIQGNGDFRSEACVELLKESDIIVTNGPFSLFRDFTDLLMEYGKKFAIVGNVNAITYKNFFPFIKSGKVWMGPSIHGGDREFLAPDDYPLNASGWRIDEKGRKYIRIKGVRWWTNLDYQERHLPLDLSGHSYRGNETRYPRYDNYDAIEVSKTADIPDDYGGVMGVPITFLDKYCPEQFEIVWIACGSTYANAPKDILDSLKFDPAIKTGGGLGSAVLNGKTKYARLLIRRRGSEPPHFHSSL